VVTSFLLGQALRGILVSGTRPAAASRTTRGVHEGRGADPTPSASRLMLARSRPGYARYEQRGCQPAAL
jgi:hypothetical protein